MPTCGEAQESVGAYVDDTSEKATAENIAMKVDGVKSVKNQIVVRP